MRGPGRLVRVDLLRCCVVVVEGGGGGGVGREFGSTLHTTILVPGCSRTST